MSKYRIESLTSSIRSFSKKKKKKLFVHSGWNLQPDLWPPVGIYRLPSDCYWGGLLSAYKSVPWSQLFPEWLIIFVRWEDFGWLWECFSIFKMVNLVCHFLSRLHLQAGKCLTFEMWPPSVLTPSLSNNKSCSCAIRVQASHNGAFLQDYSPM